MKKLDDFRLKLGNNELVPIMVGGMGVDISTTELALVAARLGGIGHISDAMVPAVTDRLYKTKFVKQKLKKYKYNANNDDKSVVQFNLDNLAEATKMHVSKTMQQKQGDGMIFINCMEKLTMNNPLGTLEVRLKSAMDAGIDGISLSAGLHLSSFGLIKDHPRFREVKLGIIVSSTRALNLFLRKTARLNRLPDFIVVEGPLAGGHLGFGMDWAKYDLKILTREVIDFLAEKEFSIPVITAGGIFTGSDAVEYMELGAAAVQVATRFTVTKECGLPDKVKQKYFKADEDDIEVNQISPTGYPMRMLKKCPALHSGVAPNCEAFGYLLNAKGSCDYIAAYNAELAKHPTAKKIIVKGKTCLCYHMRKFNCWTCGYYTYQLKNTSLKLENGDYQMLDAEHVFKDYQFSVNNQVKLPEPEVD
ncbi:MAG: nitronate monooxygenase [Gammaproteobacteria bacterium]|nr:nitronate monooxygenase [Gammaproteobacteria bacterium]